MKLIKKYQQGGKVYTYGNNTYHIEKVKDVKFPKNIKYINNHGTRMPLKNASDLNVWVQDTDNGQKILSSDDPKILKLKQKYHLTDNGDIIEQPQVEASVQQDIKNQNAEDRVEATAPTLDGLIATTGINAVTPSNIIGLALNAISGKPFTPQTILNNNGVFQGYGDSFAQQHPVVTTIVNGVTDLAALGFGKQLLKGAGTVLKAGVPSEWANGAAEYFPKGSTTYNNIKNAGTLGDVAMAGYFAGQGVNNSVEGIKNKNALQAVTGLADTGLSLMYLPTGSFKTVKNNILNSIPKDGSSTSNDIVSFMKRITSKDTPDDVREIVASKYGESFVPQNTIKKSASGGEDLLVGKVKGVNTKNFYRLLASKQFKTDFPDESVQEEIWNVEHDPIYVGIFHDKGIEGRKYKSGEIATDKKVNTQTIVHEFSHKLEHLANEEAIDYYQDFIDTHLPKNYQEGAQNWNEAKASFEELKYDVYNHILYEFNKSKKSAINYIKKTYPTLTDDVDTFNSIKLNTVYSNLRDNLVSRIVSESGIPYNDNADKVINDYIQTKRTLRSGGYRDREHQDIDQDIETLNEFKEQLMDGHNTFQYPALIRKLNNSESSEFQDASKSVREHYRAFKNIERRNPRAAKKLFDSSYNTVTNEYISDYLDDPNNQRWMMNEINNATTNGYIPEYIRGAKERKENELDIIYDLLNMIKYTPVAIPAVIGKTN